MSVGYWLPRGRQLPRPVGQREVEEVERGGAAVADAAQEALELRATVLERACGIPLLARPELSGRPPSPPKSSNVLSTAGRSSSRSSRQEQVQRPTTRRSCASDLQPVAPSPSRALAAEALRAELGGRLLHVEAVAPPEHREEAPRVVGRDRKRVPRRLGARQHGGYRALRGVVHAGRVRGTRSCRGRARRSPGTARRRCRRRGSSSDSPDSSSSTSITTGRPPSRGPARLRRLLRQHELGHGRDQQEVRHEQDGGGGQHGHERADPVDPRVEPGPRPRRGRAPGRSRRRCRPTSLTTWRAIVAASSATRRGAAPRRTRGQRADGQLGRAPSAAGGTSVRANATSEDVPARVAAGHEELGRVAEQVQQRLRDGEGPQRRQVQPGDEHASGARGRVTGASLASPANSGALVTIASKSSGVAVRLPSASIVARLGPGEAMDERSEESCSSQPVSHLRGSPSACSSWRYAPPRSGGSASRTRRGPGRRPTRCA